MSKLPKHIILRRRQYKKNRKIKALTCETTARDLKRQKRNQSQRMRNEIRKSYVACKLSMSTYDLPEDLYLLYKNTLILKRLIRQKL